MINVSSFPIQHSIASLVAVSLLELCIKRTERLGRGHAVSNFQQRMITLWLKWRQDQAAILLFLVVPSRCLPSSQGAAFYCQLPHGKLQR